MAAGQIDTTFFNRCILTLERAYSLVEKADPESIEYDMYRSACVKEFEMILEQAGKLLKKCLKPFFHSPKAVDKLVFKDLFRQASQHDLITIEQAENWLIYRDNRNTTAHDYGVHFADKTLTLLDQFIIDAKAIEMVFKASNHD